MFNSSNRIMDNTFKNKSVLPEDVRQQYLQAMGIQTWFDPHQPALQAAASVLDEAPNKPESAPPLNSSVEQQPVAQQKAEAPLAETALVEIPLTEIEAPLQPNVVTNASVLSIDALNLSIEQCQLCELHTTRKQAVCGEGHGQADLFIIIDSPVNDSQGDGALFSLENKKMLQAMLSAIGFDLASVFMSSLVKCKPPEQRAPQTSEVICCDEHLSSQIKRVQPQAILVLGELASQQLLVSQKSLTDLRLRHHQHLGVPVFASYHPQALFNSSETKRKVWADLLQIKRQITNKK